MVEIHEVIESDHPEICNDHVSMKIENIQEITQKLENIAYRLTKPQWVDTALNDLISITYNCSHETMMILFQSQAFSRFVDLISSDCSVKGLKVLVNLTKDNDITMGLIKIGIINLIFQAILSQFDEFIDLSLKILTNVVSSTRIAQISVLCVGILTTAEKFYNQNPLIRFLTKFGQLIYFLFTKLKEKTNNEEQIDEENLKIIFNSIPDIDCATALYTYQNGVDIFFTDHILPILSKFWESNYNEIIYFSLKTINLFLDTEEFCSAFIFNTNFLPNSISLLQREDLKLTQIVTHLLNQILYKLEGNVYPYYKEYNIFEITIQLLEITEDKNICIQCCNIISNMIVYDLELVERLNENQFLDNFVRNAIHSSKKVSTGAVWLVSNLTDQYPDLTVHFFADQDFIEICNTILQGDPNTDSLVILKAITKLFSTSFLKDENSKSKFLELIDVSTIEDLTEIGLQIGEYAKQCLSFIKGDDDE
ncbi:hypothetical protein TVAG_179630 [Trichomonas vaginalis G3]|uniref:Uncharacterized protein n=1 Tax=Trichomonas vaginalis (strain ATCC PRA-98 / G3) TaxID=412133 RepID=A2F445_TRIV3|nr:armadillo (ARM) repeat-containing protein family [Trichomonas vaginalis G3]EAY00292.1 hypothetical protein TVAG_179630 [Trichomonas vaginalis G3]KAI5490865.1 armadillo (ARM) repeat-containing protein family [Trichomonas vaginalis G3]|eukprot:XP_001313221.1 hypothetical protein [Trichomonas vaginalis G3]